MKRFENRWALIAELSGTNFLLGRYCHEDGNEDEPRIRTFRTQKLARQAKRKMTSYSTIAKVVKVLVTIEVI